MYRKILVGYDGSDQAKDALALGRQLADTTGAELAVASVFALSLPVRGGFTPVPNDADRELERQLEQVAESVGAAAHPVRSTSPARGLHELAEEIEADLIVVGSSRHGGLGQTLLGNVGVALMHGCPCAVAIAPRGYSQAQPGISSIVVGYDGSPESQLALESACELARASDAPLKLVSVPEPPDVTLAATGGISYGWEALKDALEEQARQRLDEARTSIADDLQVEATLVSGAPADALAEAASGSGSLLLVGSRAYGPVRRVLLGSVSRELAGSAPAPLIVHPRGMHDQPKTVPSSEAGTTA